MYTRAFVGRRTHKPPLLAPGSEIAVISPASPADAPAVERGCNELRRLGYILRRKECGAPPGSYFAGDAPDRTAEFVEAIREREVRAAFCARGGYGSNYLADKLKSRHWAKPKIVLGYSDITSLQAFLWETSGWVTFYGPMVAAGFDGGAGKAGGYDSISFRNALTQASSGWMLELGGETLVAGDARGTLLGGCLTLVETTLGTPWELDTAGSILLLEDRAMKPYQVDRALMHLKQAGKFERVRGIVLGEFLECEPAPPAGGPAVRDVCRRILGSLGVPVVWGVPIGHTSRPMLTVPLGVRARLRASGPGRLEILEPAVSPLRAK